jgi:hypothetical protein
MTTTIRAAASVRAAVWMGVVSAVMAGCAAGPDACSGADPRKGSAFAVEACTQVWQASKPGTNDESRTLYNLGLAQKRNFDIAEAEATYLKALELEERLSGPYSLKSGRRLAELMGLWYLQGKEAGAEANLLRLMAIAPLLKGSEAKYVASIFLGYADVYRKKGNEAFARNLEDHARNLGYTLADFPDHPKLWAAWPPPPEE